MTPAAERALNAASQWALGPDGHIAPIRPVELIVGLLSESECRAARLLLAAGVDLSAVESRWPELAFTAGDDAASNPDGVALLSFRGLSADVEACMRAACDRLDEPVRTFQFATEHLLLGLTLADDEAGSWLRERGVDAESIERDHARIYGGDRAPIAIELDAIPLADDFPLANVGSSEIAEPAITTVSDESGRRGAVRIIDAAANRAGEALRVVEDYVRFIRNDRALTSEAKAMRHELAAALAPLSLTERLAARDTRRDVGTDVTTAAEMTRRNPLDVAVANLRRLQESLRSLEEFTKVIDSTMAARCEALRYRSYTLQKDVAASDERRPSMADASLYVLVDGRESVAAFEAIVGKLVAAGVDVLQLRDKQLDDRTLLDRARRLRRLTIGTPVRFIMNDRPDLALLAEADGVHVGQDELNVAAARRIVGAGRLVGVSTHSLEQARQAATDGADYIGVGPVFPSTTKNFVEFPGLDLVRVVARETVLPAFAIGGITVDNVEEVVRAGLRRAAVGGAVLNAADPQAAVAALRRRLSER